MVYNKYNEDTDKRKSQNKLAREHRCLDRAEFEISNRE